MPLLEVEDLSVRFALHQTEVTAVGGLDFTLEEGETLAVVGESGSGKSQAFLAIMGLLASNGRAAGRARLGDADLLALPARALDAYRGRDVAMIFQDPMTSLNPALKVKTQLVEVLVRHRGFAPGAALREAIGMLERVGIPEPQKRAEAYPHELSGGMRQRVMIAMALLCRPKLLIADEPTTALDVTVQAQVLDLFKSLTDEFGTALVLISHDLGVVAGLAVREMVMYAGRAIETAGVEDLFYAPRHPYTLGLLASTPDVEAPAQRLASIEGLPPSLEHVPPGCAFHPRCPYRFEPCFTERPRLLPVAEGHAKACHYRGPLERRAVA
jgi:oligopeptide transport system ATP-binding protein